MSEIDVKEFDYTSLDVSMVEEFASNPIWELLMTETKRRLVINRLDLERGDIAIRTATEEGTYMYRTNEALRGGILELIFALNFTEGLKEDIIRAKEDALNNEIELEDEDDGS